MSLEIKRWGKSVRRYAPWGVASILVILLVLWLGVPVLVRDIAVEQVNTQFGRKLEIGASQFNPLTLRLHVENVSLYEADERTPAFKLKSLSLKLSLSALLRRAVGISELVLDSPDLHLVRQKDGKNNFSDVIDRVTNKPAKPDQSPTRFVIANVEVHQAKVDIDDQIVGRHTVVDALELGLPFMSDLPSDLEVFVTPKLSGRIDGAKFALGARAHPFTPNKDATIAIDLEQLALPDFSAYVTDHTGLKLSSGTLTTKLDLSFERRDTNAKISLKGKLDLDQLHLHDLKGEPVLGLAHLTLALNHSDLIKGSAEIGLLRLDKPDLHIALDEQGRLNLLPKATEQKEASNDKAEHSKKEVPEIGIDDLIVDGGSVTWRDQRSISNIATLDASNLRVKLGHFSTHSEKLAAFEFASTVKAGGVIDASATIDVRGMLGMHDGQFSFNGEQARIQDLILAKPGGGTKSTPSKLMSLKDIIARHAEIDLTKHQLQLGELLFDNGDLSAVRLANGQFDFPQFKTDKTPKSTQPWSFGLDKLDLKDISIAFFDNTINPAATVTLGKLAAHAEHISSDPNKTLSFTLDTSINQGNPTHLTADWNTAARSLNLSIDAKSIPLTPLQGYFASALELPLADGSLSALGKFGLKLPTDGSASQISYIGNLGVANLRLRDATGTSDLASWKSLTLTEVNAKLGAGAPVVEIGRLAVNGFYARLLLTEAGELNLHRPAKAGDAVDGNAASDVGKNKGSDSDKESSKKVAKDLDKAADKGPAAIIRVKDTAFIGGSVNFTDRFIRPNYHVTLTGVNGTVGSIASDSKQSANIAFKGLVDGSATLEANGVVNPLAKPLQLDMKVDVVGLDLPGLTPYSAKYAGYPIEEGKLSAKLEYHVTDGQLSAVNRLILDQLKFGERVDSPNATKLPVLFAIDLLKDSNGVIDVELPISGSLSDPKFSVGGIVFEAIVHLLGRAITSPFSLLGHASGHNEELGLVEFVAGRDTPSESSFKRMEALAKALQSKPGMKLEIRGRTDDPSQLEVTKQEILLRRLKSAMRSDLFDQGEDVNATLKPLTDADRAKYIAKLYQDAKFDKPRNLIGLAKTLPTAEMEQLLLKNITVSDELLSNLAMRRAQTVRDLMEKNYQLPAERLFLMSPHKKSETSLPCQIGCVDFDLKN